MLKNYKNKLMGILIALCLCLSLMPVITPIHAHADGTDGVTVTKVASESDLKVDSLYAFTPKWQSDSTMTPYGSYEYKSWIFSSYGGGMILHQQVVE